MYPISSTSSSIVGILTLIATVYGDGYGGYGGGKSDSDGRESANCSAPFPDKYNGNCYNISSVEVNATSARKMCHDLGGDLAKLDGTTSEERQSFAEFIGMGQYLTQYSTLLLKQPWEGGGQRTWVFM